jgi:hypothetical protein
MCSRPILRRLPIAGVSQLTQGWPEFPKANVMNRPLRQLRALTTLRRYAKSDWQPLGALRTQHN